METSADNRKTVRKTVRASDIPKSWRVDLPDDPEAAVEVVITLLPRQAEPSPKRFLGAGKGLFASAAEADAYIRAQRDAWEG
jgi:hypothetical protein